MIIYEAKIYRFGSITNKTIKFDNGINLIYGENEKGKTTIENFINVMLYGFGKRRDCRKKYVMNNTIIKGELCIFYENRKMIIKRSFGKTKKEDTSLIIDAETGERIDEIDLESPGMYFFNVNKSTFEKTLFIGQLAVTFKRDKDEEIMDKIMEIFGAKESEVSPTKALEKLNLRIKELRTARGIGSIDLLEKERGELLQEKYEGLKISKKNMEWENELLTEKNNRKFLNDEISKLEIYKKYIKKLSMQHEYREINDYLSKSEKLKREEDIIKSDLVKEDNIIDMNFIQDLKRKNDNLLFVEEKYNKLQLSNDNLQSKIDSLQHEKAKYAYLDEFEDNIKDKIISLKYDFSLLEDKISKSENIIQSIKNDEESIINKQKSIFNFEKVKDLSNDISKCLEEYDEKLRNLSYLIENSNENEKSSINKTKLIASFIFSLIFIVSGIFLSLKAMPYIIFGSIFISISIILFYVVISNVREYKRNNNISENIENLKDEVVKIEKRLDEYSDSIGTQDCNSLVILLKKYNTYKDYENRYRIRISEKKNILDEYEYNNLLEKFQKNKNIVSSFLNISKCSDIDEVLFEIDEYKKINSDIDIIFDKKIAIEKEKNQLLGNINILKNDITNKLSIMGLSDNNIIKVDKYIEEYTEKIKKKEEIHSNLKAIEETYNYLIKDKDIEKIKDEIKNIIDDNNDYSYKSEEEIEKQEKKYSKELIECEKNIKDLENNIKTRMIGKKNLIEIEEQLFEIEKKINRSKNKYKSLKMAYDYIADSESDIRRNIGPAINNMVSKYFSSLTYGKYKEVILNENYQMLIRYGDELIEQQYLSSGALDQLYLCLRIAFINLIFKDKQYVLFLDDAFVQYDDKRREKAVLFLANTIKNQCFIFTCQKNEEQILNDNSFKYKLIDL